MTMCCCVEELWQKPVLFIKAIWQHTVTCADVHLTM
jgi:hypothetical protein